ncbi:MAG: hypothetical protein WAV02_01695 [Stellaceae bacterium]
MIPLVQQRATHLPPALILVFQIILGTLAGFLCLLVATGVRRADRVGADALRRGHARRPWVIIGRRAMAARAQFLTPRPKP